MLLGWQPDNQALLITRFASGGLAPRGYPVTIYDVAQASFATWLPQSRAMQKGQWSPDGRYVALTGLFSGVRVYDAQATRLLFEFAREGTMGQQLVWSPDSQAIAAVRVMPDYSERLIVAEAASHTVVGLCRLKVVLLRFWLGPQTASISLVAPTLAAGSMSSTVRVSCAAR